MKNEPILNVEQQNALERMLAGDNVFLTGPAGTGKTAVIRMFMQQCRKKLVCLAPTGLAALNLGKAVTIHHFFEFGPEMEDPMKQSSPNLLKKLAAVDVFLIDEISMVSSLLLHRIENLLSQAKGCMRPFGGKQIIVVGDFHQLPPVISDENLRGYVESKFQSVFAFAARAWIDASFTTIVLRQFIRQRDPDFIEILQAIRYGNHDMLSILKRLNVRVMPRPDHAVTLCCRRCDADSINQIELSKLHDTGKLFVGKITGIFPEEDMPTSMNLTLKRGEKIMLLANHAGKDGYDYVNGDIGTVLDYNESMVKVSLKWKIVLVKPHRWTKYDYIFDQEKEILSCCEIGSYTQMPIISAYAMTIHKAQGLTLDKVHIHLGNGCFENGQFYTALSRVRCMNDLTLEIPAKAGDLIVNPLIQYFSKDESAV